MENNKIKLFTVTLATAIIMSLLSIVMYSNICAPKFYDYFIDTGIKYLTDGNYEEAILTFNKAIEIEEKSTEARVYLAEGYIGNNEYDNAVEVLEEAQNIDITNEELLINILEILSGIDADIAYEFLDRFINAIGKDNISKDIEDMLNSAYKSPENPIVYPAPGTYIKPISIKLKLDEIKIGHSFYYTTDGSDPNKYSQKYRGKIDIDKSTTIKLIGYNKNEESTEIITLDYKIDTNIVKDIENTVNESKELLNNTKIGTNVGDITEKAKKAFKLVIDKVSNLLKKEQLSYNDARNMKIEIENAFETFEDNIIKPTDKSKLQSTINKAQNLYNSSKEGSKSGEFKVGSKATLQKAINDAKKVYEYKISTQDEVDKKVVDLKIAISNFEKNKIALKKPILTQSQVNEIKSRIGFYYEYKPYFNPDKDNSFYGKIDRYHVFIPIIESTRAFLVDINTFEIYETDEGANIRKWNGEE